MARKLRHLNTVALDKHTHKLWRWQKNKDCRECHKLLLTWTNTWQGNLTGESKHKYDRARKNWIKTAQNKTLEKPDVANRRGTDWTDWELNIALDPDLTISEKCAKLERTYYAIKTQIRDSQKGL